MSDQFPVLLDQFGPTGVTPASKGDLQGYLPLTGGTMRGPLDMGGQDITNVGDFWSANWDGAIPANLATEDATATAGGYFDGSLGTLQLEQDLFVGGTSNFTGAVTLGSTLTMTADAGVINAGPANNRVILSNATDNYRIIDDVTDRWADAAVMFDRTWSTAGITTDAVVAAYDGAGGSQDYIFIAGPHRGTELADSGHLSLGIQNTTFETKAWLEADETFIGHSGGAGFVRNYGDLRLDDGLEGTPVLTFNAEQDTGLFRGGSDSIAWTASGNIQGQLSLGITVGAAPTGGAKGIGTINCAADVYKNNSAYSNPDWVFEMASTGRVSKYADNLPDDPILRLIPLGELERYVMKHWHLPGISPDPMGMFERGDIALEWIERLVLYTFDLEERIGLLEAE